MATDNVALDSATGRLVRSPAPVSPEYTMATNEDETLVATERVIGGGVFDGSAVGSSQTVTFRWIGSITDAGPTALGAVRLYDVGSISTPAAPVLIADTDIDLTTTPADDGVTKVLDLALTLGTPAAGVISASPRVYEVRDYITAGGGGETMKILWAGLVVSG
jgi:hypothetical protein